MKKKLSAGKRAAALGMAVALVLSCSACGSGNKEAADSITFAPVAANGAQMSGGTAMSDGMYDTSYAEAPMEVDEGFFYAGAEESAPLVSNPAADVSSYYADRKLIKTVNLEVETREFDQMLATLEGQVNALGGYIESMYSYNGSQFNTYRDPVRNATMTLRIPKQQLDSFLDTVSAIGNVVSRSENVEDVTLSYVDLESHRDSLRMEQERLMELMERAESVEDLITVEDRISYVRYQLESMESQLRTYDNRVDFSTVYLNIREVKELTPVREETVLERIVNGFTDNLKGVGEGFLNFGIWILVHIPTLVVWAVIIIVIVLIVRRCRKKKAARKAARVKQTPGVPMQEAASKPDNKEEN